MALIRNILAGLRRRILSVWIKFLRWQRLHVSDGLLLIIISIVTGLLTGIAAAGLKAGIKFIQTTLLGHFDLMHSHYAYLIWPIVGIILTMLFQRYVIHRDLSQVIKIIRGDLDTQQYNMSPYMIFNPLIGCAMTIGFGASAGSESPTALSGSAIGSTISRWFGLSQDWTRIMLGIGAGAGIAAIFKSPIGGALFTLEILQMKMTTLPILGLMLACLLASTTAYVLSNFTFDIFFFKSLPFDPSWTGWVLLLGVFCGLYGTLYDYIKRISTNWFASIRNPWVAALVTGGVLSLCTYLFPSFFGEGFGVITSLVNGEPFSFTSSGAFAGKVGIGWLIGALAAILILKGVLVAASMSGGGIAGDFVPTLFAGAVAGYFFAIVFNNYLGTDLPVWFFALLGMGAVMSSTLHAPLMAIFILCETTNTYAYIMPYLLATGVAYAVVKIISPKSWYCETGHDDMLALMNIGSKKVVPATSSASPITAPTSAPEAPEASTSEDHVKSEDNTTPDQTQQ